VSIVRIVLVVLATKAPKVTPKTKEQCKREEKKGKIGYSSAGIVAEASNIHSGPAFIPSQCVALIIIIARAFVIIL